MDDPLLSALFDCYYDSSAVNWDWLNTEVTVDPVRFMALVLWWGWRIKVPLDAYYYYSCDVYGWTKTPMIWLTFEYNRRKGIGCQSSAGSPKPAI